MMHLSLSLSSFYTQELASEDLSYIVESYSPSTTPRSDEHVRDRTSSNTTVRPKKPFAANTLELSSKTHDTTAPKASPSPSTIISRFFDDMR